MKLNILGTEYELILDATVEDYPFLEQCNGYCNLVKKQIVINKYGEDYNEDEMHYFRNALIRHEVVHAFLFESGLGNNTEWADNEEIVDWIALQVPKMVKTFEQAEKAIESTEVSSEVYLDGVKVAEAINNFKNHKGGEYKHGRI